MKQKSTRIMIFAALFSLTTLTSVAIAENEDLSKELIMEECESLVDAFVANDPSASASMAAGGGKGGLLAKCYEKLRCLFINKTPMPTTPPSPGYKWFWDDGSSWRECGWREVKDVTKPLPKQFGPNPLD